MQEPSQLEPRHQRLVDSSLGFFSVEFAYVEFIQHLWFSSYQELSLV
jgi:hypothetical protein